MTTSTHGTPPQTDAGPASNEARGKAAQWRDTARYLTYRGLGFAMGHVPEQVAYGVADVVSRFMARGPRLEMNQRHMRRVLASECADGVEPDLALVRRWSRRTFTSYARYWADGARLPYVGPDGVRAALATREWSRAPACRHGAGQGSRGGAAARGQLGVGRVLARP